MSNKMPQKLALFEYRFSTPTLSRKIENNQKTKTDVHNFIASGIQIHLIWFSSFNTFGAVVRKPPKNLQRAITRDWKLTSERFFINEMEFKNHKCPENLSKFHAEMRKILKFQKASRRKKKNNKNNLNQYNNRKVFSWNRRP